MDEVLAASGREGFPAAWLDAQGLPWAADLIRAFPLPPDQETAS